jgi:glycerol-3-phosphate acyltransferase PlsY
MLKGIIPVMLATFFLDTDNICFSLVMIAPVLGHAVGIFNRFHGGKCISTAFGVLIGILHITLVGFILAVLYILFSTLIKISPNSRRSILSFSLFITISTPLLIVFGLYSIAIGCIGISLVAIIKHLKLFTKIEADKRDDNGESNEKVETPV